MREKTKTKFNFTIEIPIYKQDLAFVFCKGPKGIVKYLDKYFTEEDKKFISDQNYNTKGKFFSGLDNNIKIIWMPKTPETHAEYGYLAHEIFHAVSYIADHVGIGFCDESEEAIAYLIGHITEQALENIEKAKNFRKYLQKYLQKQKMCIIFVVYKTIKHKQNEKFNRKNRNRKTNCLRSLFEEPMVTTIKRRSYHMDKSM